MREATTSLKPVPLGSYADDTARGFGQPPTMASQSRYHPAIEMLCMKETMPRLASFDANIDVESIQSTMLSLIGRLFSLKSMENSSAQLKGLLLATRSSRALTTL